MNALKELQKLSRWIDNVAEKCPEIVTPGCAEEMEAAIVAVTIIEREEA